MLEAQRLWLEAQRLWLEAQRLWLEAQRLWLEAQRLWLEAQRLWLEAQRLWLEPQRLRYEAEALCLEAQRLRLEAEALCLEAQRLRLELQRACLEQPSTPSARSRLLGVQRVNLLTELRVSIFEQFLVRHQARRRTGRSIERSLSLSRGRLSRSSGGVEVAVAGTRMSRAPHSSSFLGGRSDTPTSSRRNAAHPVRPTDGLGALHEHPGLPALACLLLLAGCGSRTGLEIARFDGGIATLGDGGDGDAGPTLSPWPLYQRDRAHSGRSPFIGPARPVLQWVVHTDGSIDSPVIGADGTIYFGSSDTADNAFSLHAVGADGLEKWVFPVGSYPSLSPAVGGDGTIYLGSEDNHLYAVAPDGTERWDLELGDVVGTPTVGSDGTVYVGSLDKHLYAIRPGGTVAWSFAAEDGVFWPPAIGSDGALYFGAWANYGNAAAVAEHLYAVNPDGSSRWAFQAGGVLYSPALGSDGTIYVRAGGATLDAVSSAGTQKWTAPVDIYSSAAPAVAADGTVYIGSGQGQLSAVGADGHVKWVSSIDTVCSRCAPTIGGDGTIYLLAFGNNVYALDPDGNVKWTFQPSASSSHTGDSTSVVIGADGTLYFGDDEGDLFAIGQSP